MHLISKYGIGDTVYLSRLNAEVIKVPCPVCNGTGRAEVVGFAIKANCPACYSSGYKPGFDESSLRHYTRSVMPLTIGQVRVTATASRSTLFMTEEVEYMCVETGVGSGSIYREHLLFATREEAEALPVPLDEPISEPLKVYCWPLPVEQPVHTAISA